MKADIKLETVGFYKNTPDYGYNSKTFSIKGDRIEEEKSQGRILDNKCPIPKGAVPYKTKRFRGYRKKIKGEWRLVGPGRTWYDDKMRFVKHDSCRHGGGFAIGWQTSYDKKGNIWNKYWQDEDWNQYWTILNGKKIKNPKWK